MFNPSCIFCKVINHELPSKVIKQDDYALTIQNIAPQAPIHYLIIPRHHYTDLKELDSCCIGYGILDMARQLSKSEPGASDFRVLINNGFGAGQRVFHLHMHFLAGTQLPEF